MGKNAVEPVTNQTSLGFYNWLFLVPKPNNRWRPILDLSNLKKFLKTESFKMETPETIRTSLQAGEWVTSLQGRILPYTHSKPVKEVHAFSCTGQFIPNQSTTIRPLHSPHGVYSSGQRGQVSCITKGYKNPSVPRRLVGLSQIPPNLSPAYTDLGTFLSGPGIAIKHRKIRIGASTSLQFRRLPVRLREGRVRPTQDRWQTLQTKIKALMAILVCPVRKLMSLRGFTHCHRETSTSRSPAHEANPMALKKPLEGTGVTRKGDSRTQVSPSPSAMVAGGRPCATRSTITPTKTCSANLYRHIKRRVGRSLKRAHRKGNLVPSGKQTTHKLPGIKSSLSGIKTVPGSLSQQDSTDSYR